ncbi:MAG: phage terminase large subunit family protein [Nevskia sp.]|nr:phage terminase large subunit family protein [Nevskia sp.]
MTAALPLSITHCLERLALAVKPRDRLTVSQWADKYRKLSSKDSGEIGNFRTSRHPMMREIMDSLSDFSPVREVTLVFPSQFGKTLITTNWIGYTMHHAPAPMLGLMPTLESRDKWKIQKLNPLLMETPVIRDLLGGMKSRDAANSKESIDFPGGILFLGGGNSSNSYAQVSAKKGYVDDLDRFPWEIGVEGGPVGLFRGRFKGFPRYKFLKISTPTILHASLILIEYEQSDRRRYHVHCPACGAAQHLKWSNLKWDQTHNPPAWAEYECDACGHGIQEHFKPKLLNDGIWIPEKPEVTLRRGYHANNLYSPIALGPSWLDMAHEFLLSKNDPSTFKVFVNTMLAEGFEDQTSALKTNELEKRMEIDHELMQIPPGVVALTAFIDTQDTWLDCHLLGWHEGGYRLIDWHQVQGDTARPEVWNEAAAWLNAPRTNAWGRPLAIRAAGVDSRGHRGQQVRTFVQRADLRVRVYACQGSTSRMGRAIATSGSYPDKDRRGKTVKSGYCVWNIGTEFCKDYLYGHLVADGALPVEDRRYRFPAGLPTDYFDGLLSEVYNPETKRYEVKKGARYKRNEPLDGITGCWAIGQHKEVNIGRFRNGKPDPGWFARARAVLEAGEPGQADAVIPASVDAQPAAVAVPLKPAPGTRVAFPKRQPTGW